MPPRIEGRIEQTAPAAGQQARGRVLVSLDRVKASYDLRHPNVVALSVVVLVSFALPLTLLFFAPGWDTVLGAVASAIAFVCGFIAFPVVIKPRK